MSRFGKCQNSAGCLLAYRGEETEIEDGQPFICSECGKPLLEVKPPSAMWLRYLTVIGGVVVAAALAFAIFPPLRGLIVKKKSDHDETASKPRVEDSASSETTGSTAQAPETSSAPAAEPPPVVTAPAQIDMDMGKQENKTVKAEVLKRVDLMPKVSNPNKDKLYGAVERARKMGIILTIPFGSGKTELSASDIATLKSELEKPELSKMRGDPTLVFVILGYADPKGDAQKNITISQARADTVLKAMRDKCDVINVMHTVGMGGSKLLDAKNLEKNRIVEVWAVLP